VKDPRKKLVEAGYDAMADAYLGWAARIEGDPRARFLDEFTNRLADGARVLDLGCGAGMPSTRMLAQRFDVVGVDISEGQLELAREHVPQATFIHGDIAETSFADASFAGVVALYSISHLPRDEHAVLFRSIARWLEPGGLFLATLSAGETQDWCGEWLGVPMFFSGHDADTNRALLTTAGFALLRDEIVEMREPEETVSFLWVLAQKSA
jgi:ubiquinone/menaquinone biosynthesis C-methylase UbiE